MSLTRQLGIEVPLICGAMYPCSNPELVGAVSGAGRRHWAMSSRMPRRRSSGSK